MKEQLITKKILKWYDLNKRSLPWRKNVSLQKRQYYILVSEFMLQQTQVVTVIPYFNRFIKNIPNLKTLARVQNKKLMKLWEGLGYYSRARNLKKTSKVIIKNFKGIIPDNFEDLKSLPGIGDYTARAILSIAFNKPYIPLDGNIERVLNCKVLDRTNLILDIFAFRASTAYSRTQVELAQYQYLLPRLTNLWTHLSKQKGGIGMKGPGEKEIETDRRVIRKKIFMG